jgi:hypothetical protein
VLKLKENCGAKELSSFQVSELPLQLLFHFVNFHFILVLLTISLYDDEINWKEYGKDNILINYFVLSRCLHQVGFEENRNKCSQNSRSAAQTMMSDRDYKMLPI